MRPSEILQACHLLDTFTAAERESVLLASRPATFEKGEIIWFRTEPESISCAIGRGFVKMSRPNAAGQEVALEIFGPGQVFGLNGVLDGTGCPLQASAITKVDVVKIPASAIRPIFTSNIEWKDAVLLRTLGRLRERIDILARTWSSRVEERIAAILLVLAESYGRRTAHGVILDVPLTRAEIGELAGTTTETTIRVLSRWQKEGMVETERQTITIKDLNLMESVFHHTVG